MAKILIIDDDACNRDILKTRLEQSSYEVVEASNGEEGVRIAGDIRPDLIILDVMMPKVDGWLACRILKSKEETKDIPVVMLTARSQQLEEMRGWESGADEYVTKPCDHQRLLAAVAQLLIQAPQQG
ncbi:MAG: response regulator [Elusimicrobia bacterium]|nr:response regulator [Elusimicrobiota bacterium]